MLYSRLVRDRADPPSKVDQEGFREGPSFARFRVARVFDRPIREHEEGRRDPARAVEPFEDPRRGVALRREFGQVEILGE